MAIQFGIGTLVASGMDFGYLQNCNVDFAFEEATLHAGSGLYPIDVRIHTATITGKAAFADIDIEISSLWDFRHLPKEENNIGLIVYISKIHVY